MTAYLSYTFNDSLEFINTFDELPLWSASFGLLLLKHVELKPNLTVIDIGSGSGFPLMELAGRLGKSCQLYGLDPWVNANTRAQQKIRNYELTNVSIIEGSASQIPFDGNTIDLIVSNLGINNFDNPMGVFKECNRVLKKSGKLVLTTNLNGHWQEFYTVFENTLTALNKSDILDKLLLHQQHRGNVESISSLFTTNGFKISKCKEEYFEMKFLDGSAFLNHYFVKLGWLSSWKELIPYEELTSVFSLLEGNLNTYAQQNNGLVLNVPMAYIEGAKIQ